MCQKWAPFCSTKLCLAAIRARNPPNQYGTKHFKIFYPKIICDILYLTRIDKNIFISVGKTGSIGIQITFADATATAYQLMGYGVYPKAALIDKTGNCKLVDNI